MPFYDFQCDREHTTERYFSVEDKPFAIKCPLCRGEALQVILTAPATHTLATFSGDCSDEVVQRTRDPGDGSYFDPNLGFDRHTGKYTRITSKRQRERLIKEAGLFEREPSDRAKDVASERRRKPKHYSGVGGRA